jgi:hypothetical protein
MCPKYFFDEKREEDKKGRGGRKKGSAINVGFSK